MFQVSKSYLVGIFSTIANLGSLALLVQVFGVTPNQANFPSLLLGSVVQFFCQRHFVFKPSGTSFGGQAIRYAIADVIAFYLNIVGFDFLLKVTSLHYTFVRMLTTFLVYIGFSYPAWKLVVFREKVLPPEEAS